MTALSSARRGAVPPRWLRLLLADRRACISLAIVVFMAGIALLAPLLSPYDPTGQNIVNALKPPSLGHPFGTDMFGRDIFSRVIHGTQPALVIGLLSVLVSLSIGVPAGVLSGFVGGRLDDVVSAVVDVLLSFPSLLMSLMIIALLQSSIPIVILAIGIGNIPIFIRMARSSTLLVKEMDYVAAGRGLGAGNGWLISRHILPNVVGPSIVVSTLTIASAIREEAALSFLGLGVRLPDPSWGNLIRDGVSVVLQAPWLAVIPGLFLTVTVLAFNILGDSVRDVLDPTT